MKVDYLELRDALKKCIPKSPKNIKSLEKVSTYIGDISWVYLHSTVKTFYKLSPLHFILFSWDFQTSQFTKIRQVHPCTGTVVSFRQYWNRRKMWVCAQYWYAQQPFWVSWYYGKVLIRHIADLSFKGSVSRILRWILLYINRKLSLRPIIGHKILSLLKG